MMYDYNKSFMKKFFYVLIWIIVCLATGYISRLFHSEAMLVWYPFLKKSMLTPPDMVFPIVWGMLYVLMGISVGILNGRQKGSRRILLWLFAIQLLLNISWNFIFFYAQCPLMGLVNLLALDALAVVYFAGVLKIERVSAYLFLPYLVWILFATYLNLYILVNNWY